MKPPIDNNKADKSFSTIGKALGIPPDTHSLVPVVEFVTAAPQLLNSNNTIDIDFEYTRRNLRKVIDAGCSALQELVDIAKSGQSARAFEAVASLVKSMSEANKDLLILSEKYHGLVAPTVGNVHNDVSRNINAENIFIGTTTELQELISGLVNRKPVIDIECE